MKQFIALLKPERKKIVLISLLLLVSVAASLALPTLLSEIVDKGINQGDFDYVWKNALLMLALAIIGVVLMLIVNKLLAEVYASYGKRIRDLVFQKANTLTYETVNKIGPSSLLTRSTEDVWVITMMASVTISSMVTVPMFLIGGTVLAFIRDWSLAIIMFASVPILVVVLILISRKTMPLWLKSDKYIDIQNAIIKERLTGIRVIRAFNKEEHEMKRAKDATNVMAENIIKANVHMGLVPPLAVLVLNLTIILIYTVGAHKMQQPGSALSAGNIVSVIEYVALAMMSIMNLTFIFVMLPRVKASYGRIKEVLDSKGIPARVEEDDMPLEGNIRFENVEFLYPNALAPSVTNLNFEIKKGEKVSFIGGTGSGKTTIINLLMGFFNNTSGNIYFDNQDISTISEHRRRTNISCVLQKSNIFKGTIKSNVLMGRKDASDEEVCEAIKTAQLGSFLKEHTEGLDYEIQPKGSNLSGGQKQRLAMARAILKNAPIYVFDDSFSSLDFLTESRIRKKLNEKLSGSTQIYITQRVASAMGCDQIFVLDKGEIIARGKHKDLLESCKLYREIYLSQTGGALLNETLTSTTGSNLNESVSKTGGRCDE
ncbi:MAG TPA: ABC transporter ATP-binding protein [Clostridia bacterium]|jgi:ATP-binding cassette subfamily B protein|nr:ABC transporter ATP-binding protein [Clostridia bacterium]